MWNSYIKCKQFLKWRWTKANSKRYPLRLSRGLYDWGQLSITCINFYKRWSFREGVSPSVFKCGVDIFPLNLLTFSPQTRYILQILIFIHLAQLISIFERLRNQCKCKIADINNTSLVFFFLERIFFVLSGNVSHKRWELSASRNARGNLGVLRDSCVYSCRAYVSNGLNYVKSKTSRRLARKMRVEFCWQIAKHFYD